MAFDAGRLRHVVDFEERVDTQDAESGGIGSTWNVIYANVRAAIEPLSAREAIEAAKIESAITTRITVRMRPGMSPAQRIVHGVNCCSGQVGLEIFNPQGFLRDKDSGLEYVTIPCSLSGSDVDVNPAPLEDEEVPPEEPDSETFQVTAGVLTFNDVDYVGADPIGYVTGTVFGSVDPDTLDSGYMVLEFEANVAAGDGPPQTVFGFALQLEGGFDVPPVNAFASISWTGPDGVVTLERFAADNPSGSAGADSRFWAWTLPGNYMLDGGIYTVTIVY